MITTLRHVLIGVAGVLAGIALNVFVGSLSFLLFSLPVAFLIIQLPDFLPNFLGVILFLSVTFVLPIGSMAYVSFLFYKWLHRRSPSFASGIALGCIPIIIFEPI